MARVIEFYIPTQFRSRVTTLLQAQPGKVIEFRQLSQQPLDEQGYVWLRKFADQAAVATMNARAFEDRVPVNAELTNETAERQRAEEALQQTEAKLAHFDRFSHPG